MIAAMLSGFRVMLFEGSNGQRMEAPRRAEIARLLLEQGYPIQISSHIGPRDGVGLLVLGDFPANQPPQPDRSGDRIFFRSIAGAAATVIPQLVESILGELQITKRTPWKPWFPVIDYDRCTNCMQCLSFCLFDVYGVTKEGKIQVQNENNCKTDCPACSRVCPEVAILFPKYRFGPINGEKVSVDDVRREAMKVDISALLGGNIYQALRDRSEHAKSRFSKERDEDRALKERQRCLTKLSQAMDIPAEVFASLPSTDQILAKAAQAKARAEAALEQNRAAAATEGA